MRTQRDQLSGAATAGWASSVSRTKRKGIAALLAVAALALAGCGDGGMAQSGDSGATAMGEHASGAAFGHVHGLGINPSDGALFIATHGGLFRAAAGDAQARQVGKSQQDLMGFTVLGPNQFVASGHPDPAAGGPSSLGLVRSDDAGRAWSQVSLLGEADFHVLRAAGQTIYGFDQSRGLMVSTNGGRSWQTRTPPAQLIDLAIDPKESRRIVVSTPDGVFTSANAGQDWSSLGPRPVSLLAWLKDGSLYQVDGSGTVSTSTNGGQSWSDAGSLGGQPVAFAGAGTDLYAALGDGVVMGSADGGANWTMRARH